MSGRLALHTPLCDLLGIRYPICQAGMGFVARADLAAAVSEAGGLGVIAAVYHTPDQLIKPARQVVEEIMAEAEAVLARLAG